MAKAPEFVASGFLQPLLSVPRIEDQLNILHGMSASRFDSYNIIRDWRSWNFQRFNLRSMTRVFPKTHLHTFAVDYCIREIPLALGVSEIISMSQALNQRHPSSISHAKFFWSFSRWVGSASPSCTIGAASFWHGGWSCYGCRLREIWTCHPKTGFAVWLTESWCWMNSTQFRMDFARFGGNPL